MAAGKKSFLLYCDTIHTVELLEDAAAGKLFKHILAYVNDKDPETADPLLKIAFEPIKQQLKRDLIKWENGSEDRVEKARNAGIASGEARRTKSNLVVQNELGSSKRTQRTASVSVSDNVSASVNGKHKESLLEEVGSKRVKEIANEVWKDQDWRDQVCIGLSLSTEELKKWLALFNSSVASDAIPGFDKGKYKKMSRGWISKQQANGTTVENTGLSKKSDSAPLTVLKPK